MQTLVLCGGRGTRAYPFTEDVPKPLLKVAGRPILRLILEHYARFGHTEFVLAAGYRADAVAAFARDLPREWAVEVADTGADTGTGGRIHGCLDRLGETFMATYGDGLGDVDLDALLRFHDSHGFGATVTAVPLPSQYGTLELDRHTVVGFTEKPLLRDHWINAGFFVFDRDVYAAHPHDDLERDVLPALARAGQLGAHRHEGFWKSLDTYKDLLDLEALLAEGVPGCHG